MMDSDYRSHFNRSQRISFKCCFDTRHLSSSAEASDNSLGAFRIDGLNDTDIFHSG